MTHSMLCLALGAAVVVLPSPAGADPTSVGFRNSTDYTSAGVGGLRGNGTGEIELTGVSGIVTEAILIWHGPTNSAASDANADIRFAGSSISGVNLGFSDDNCWGFDNSQAYRADVTDLVDGNGTYSLAEMRKPGSADINGASLLVFFDDGNELNDERVTVFYGNDASFTNDFDAEGWEWNLLEIPYAGGDVTLELHVGDGQGFNDGPLTVNTRPPFAPQVLDGDGQVFDGNTVPGQSSNTNGLLWDIREFDIDGGFVAGDVNDLQITMPQVNDCLSLVAAVISTRPVAVDSDGYIVDANALFGTGSFYGYVADPVNTASGNFTKTVTDLTFRGESYGLDLTRTYNAQDDGELSLGQGWQFGHDARVVSTINGRVVIRLDDGQHVTFRERGDGGYTRPGDVRGELVSTTSGFRLDYFDGTRWNFDADGLLTAITRWDGQGVTISRTDGRLVSITATTGENITFAYDADRVVSAAASDGRTVLYGYDSSGNLGSVTDVEGAVTTYLSDATNRVMTIIDPTGVSEIVNVYDDGGRVVQQTMPSGNTSSFTYDGETRTTTVVTEPGAETVTYEHDAFGRLIGLSDPAGEVVVIERQGDGQVARTVSRAGEEVRNVFDRSGMLLSTTSSVGTTEFSYDALHRLSTTTDPSGAVTTISYDGSERLPSLVVDALGATTTFDVQDGLIRSIVDADGVTTTFTYDNRVLSSRTNGLDDTWTYAYDGQGRQIGETTPLGHTISRVLDGIGRTLSTTYPDGGTVTNTYDEQGRLVSTTDQIGATTMHTYDPDTGLLAATADPEGRTTTYEYDGLGQLTEVTSSDGSVSDFDHGLLGRLNSVTDPLGNETAYTYDANGNRVEVIAPDGGVARTEYDATGRITAVTDEIGRRVENTYDPLGRLATVVLPDSTSFQYEYDVLGRVVSEIAPDGGATETAYTPGGRVDFTVDADGAMTRHAYDAAGQLATVTDPNSLITTVGYDSDGRRTSMTTPDGLQTSWVHDPVGRVLEYTDPAGVTTTRTYTLRGRVATEQVEGMNAIAYSYLLDGSLASVADALGNTTSLAYDSAGRLDERFDATGAGYSWDYNAAGDLVAETDRLGRQTIYTYDELGRVTDVTDPSGRSTSFAYDATGQLTSRTHGDGTSVAFTYDQLGRRSAMVDPTGTTSYEYDAAGRPTVIDGPGGRLEYSYDLAGRRTGITYPDGTVVTSTFDAAGRLVAIDDPRVGPITYALDDGGRLVETQLPGAPDRTFAYDGGRLATHDDGGRITRLDYDQSGRIAALTGADNHVYGYDGAGQLISADQGTDAYRYEYGPRGEVVSLSGPDRSLDMTHDANVQIASLTNETGTAGSATYDAAGRLVELVDGAGVRTSYTYDGRGLLVTVVRGEPKLDTIPYPEPDPDRKTTGKLEPIFECWSDGPDGTYVAWWGYENKSKQGPARVGRTIAHGPDNRVEPQMYDGGQPERFGIPDIVHNRPGRTAPGADAPNAFVTTGWDGSEVAWTLDGRTATASTAAAQRCAGDPEPPQRGTTELRTYDGDGSLTSITVTDSDGNESTTDLLWDMTLTVPQIVGMTDGAGITPVVYGHQREFVGTDIARFNALGDQFGAAAGGATGPFGSTRPDGDIGFGYRGELELTTSVHLRARDMVPDIAQFVRRDDLPGVVATPTYTNPYHYADNDPVNRTDPLGLRPTDLGFGPVATPQPILEGQRARAVPPPVKVVRVTPAVAVLVALVGLIDSWPSDREVDEEIAREVLYQQLDSPEIVEDSLGVDLHVKKGVDCGASTLKMMADPGGGGGASVEALRIARQKENAEGIPGTADGQTTAVALYCIDGQAGSTIARQRNAALSPEGFAQVSDPSHGPRLGSTNFHAETNALASITDFVRPRPGPPPVGSFGFVLITVDREVCNLCAGYIKRWTRRYPGIGVYTYDPTRARVFLAGIEL